jgi:hypothetical protein
VGLPVKRDQSQDEEEVCQNVNCQVRNLYRVEDQGKGIHSFSMQPSELSKEKGSVDNGLF